MKTKETEYIFDMNKCFHSRWEVVVDRQMVRVSVIYIKSDD